MLCVLVLALQHALEQIHLYDCDQELPTAPSTYLYVEKYWGAFAGCDARLACVVATGGVQYLHNTRSLNNPYIVQQAESILACVKTFIFLPCSTAHEGLMMFETPWRGWSVLAEVENCRSPFESGYYEPAQCTPHSTPNQRNALKLSLVL
jgi:hypothetical protein